MLLLLLLKVDSGERVVGERVENSSVEDRTLERKLGDRYRMRAKRKMDRERTVTGEYTMRTDIFRFHSGTRSLCDIESIHALQESHLYESHCYQSHLTSLQLDSPYCFLINTQNVN